MNGLGAPVAITSMRNYIIKYGTPSELEPPEAAHAHAGESEAQAVCELCPDRVEFRDVAQPLLPGGAARAAGTHRAIQLDLRGQAGAGRGRRGQGRGGQMDVSTQRSLSSHRGAVSGTVQSWCAPAAAAARRCAAPANHSRSASHPPARRPHPRRCLPPSSAAAPTAPTQPRRAP